MAVSQAAEFVQQGAGGLERTTPRTSEPVMTSGTDLWAQEPAVQQLDAISLMLRRPLVQLTTSWAKNA